jgi:peptide/nickel transport system substrate-binding protein
MSSRHRAVAALAFALFLTLAVPSAGVLQRSSAFAQDRTGTVVIAVDPDWRTTDPGGSYERHGQLVLGALYERLVQVVDGEPRPWLAESWTVSQNGLSYTFRLRSGPRFVSGNPVTSADVAFSFMRLKHLRGNPAFLASTIKSVDTPDPRTAVVNLEEPEGAFLAKIAQSPFSIVDGRTVRQNGGTDAANARETDRAKDYLERTSAGTGPYILRKFVLREETIIERNPNYWGGAKPTLDRMIFREIKDANAQSLSLLRGDIDIALALTSDQLNQVRSARRVKVLNGTTLNIFFILMNQDPAIGGPFANERVRSAVRAAIDYEGVRTLFGLGAVNPYNIIPTGFVGALDVNTRRQDLARARRLLSEAGFPNGIDAKVEASNFTVSGVNMITATERIQADLARAGIRLTIEPSELAVGLPRYREGRQGFSMWMWGPDYMDPANQLAFLPGEKVGLRANWKTEHDPALNQLGQRAMQESNQQRRVALLRQIQERLQDYGPWAVYLQPGSLFGVRENVDAKYNSYLTIDLLSIVKR